MQILTRKTVKTLLLILAWYVLSTSLSLYNKQTVGKDQGLFGHEAFPAPLLMSAIQFACQTFLAKFVFWLGLAQRTTTRRMPWSDYFRLVVPNGIITGLDIGFSNKSMVYINLSFYTMCKSTVPVFLLFFAFVWGIEKPSIELLGVVVVIVAGLGLLVRGETKFHMLGFGLVMTASCLSGLRFTLTQVLLHGHQSSAAMGGPLEVLESLTPVMSVTAFLFSLAWEELWAVLPHSVYFSSPTHVTLTLLAIALGAVIAFLMVWTEYQVIKETSALTFMIAGTVKEVVTVLSAVLVMGDKLTWVNCLGLVVVICGVLLFNYHKYRKLKPGDGGHYQAVESSEDGHVSDGEGKALRRPYNGGSGGGAVTAAATGGAMPSPVSAAAAAAAGASSSPLAGSGPATGSSHRAASGLLSRALGGLLARSPGGGAAAPGSELAPLLSTSASGGDLPSGGYRPTPIATAAARELDRGSDVEGRVVGLGSSGDDPAAAMALSGAGISGPQRPGRPGARGLLPAAESPGEGPGLATTPHHPLTAALAAEKLPPQASSPQLR
ncbi:hypothetical protein PLESTB_000630800 [Pleodorina starrii]|uniref:Sugar phosphate transporter domain-containing protein n=1 Tax=Pleodorina starrii TaxID=330485 RepID=A0A9W6F0S1_9CHLO|nr:hypothetical protein PLESTM_001291500 [Pleodorina starrii]GLC52453.1 hypothetical protein PLESTB_000630800 [Pleodorina starrii]GLC69700.1 hypothetical protein PLESTF_000867900 [Pleodorina starrii]